MGFVEAVQELENEEMKRDAIAHRISGISKSDFEKFLKEK